MIAIQCVAVGAVLTLAGSLALPHEEYVVCVDREYCMPTQQVDAICTQFQYNDVV
jgi:hypothetical protein